MSLNHIHVLVSMDQLCMLYFIAAPVKVVETAVAIGAGVRYVVFHFTAALDQVEVKIYEAIKVQCICGL